jgi:glycosyltransferase involved in cell wall biosynthesis
MLVADGRSPITRRWVQGLFALQHEVTLVSTYPCAPLAGARETRILPVAFAGFGGSQISGENTGQSAFPNRKRRLVSRFRSLFMAGRYLFGPLSLLKYGPELRKLVKELKPDLVHAMRIPFEGMLASYTPPEVPLVISIWGNDLTLHGQGSPWMRSLTRRTLTRANGLLADARRDIRLSYQWGFMADQPTLVVPGSGGIDLEEMQRLRVELSESLSDILPAGVPLVINPRGFRPGSVRSDVFFQAIPMVLERGPRVHFLCPAMAGQPEAQRWVQKYNLNQHVRLLPYLPQVQLWDLFMRAEISVSISEHDGTPNTLLEAMACGCFPIAGDIESLREWITPGVNGLLVEPARPQALAEALLLALENNNLRSSAAEINQRLIRERAETNLVRTQLQSFYEQVTNIH